MTERSTKKRILKAALDLFAEKGFEAVSVVEIAERVGIKAPSLYKHFKSKQGIFDALVEEMTERYQAQMGELKLDGTHPEKDTDTYASIHPAGLNKMAKELFLFYLHDEFAASFRRMLAIEQYRDPKLAALFAKQYIQDPLTFQSALFEMLIKAGRMKTAEPTTMAIHFFGPIFLLLTLCDTSPDMQDFALEQLKHHIDQFEKLYRIEPIA